MPSKEVKLALAVGLTAIAVGCAKDTPSPANATEPGVTPISTPIPKETSTAAERAEVSAQLLPSSAFVDIPGAVRIAPNQEVMLIDKTFKDRNANNPLTSGITLLTTPEADGTLTQHMVQFLDSQKRIVAMAVRILPKVDMIRGTAKQPQDIAFDTSSQAYKLKEGSKVARYAPGFTNFVDGYFKWLVADAKGNLSWALTDGNYVVKQVVPFWQTMPEGTTDVVLNVNPNQQKMGGKADGRLYFRADGKTAAVSKNILINVAGPSAFGTGGSSVDRLTPDNIISISMTGVDYTKMVPSDAEKLETDINTAVENFSTLPAVDYSRAKVFVRPNQDNKTAVIYAAIPTEGPQQILLWERSEWKKVDQPQGIKDLSIADPTRGKLVLYDQGKVTLVFNNSKWLPVEQFDSLAKIQLPSGADAIDFDKAENKPAAYTDGKPFAWYDGKSWKYGYKDVYGSVSYADSVTDLLATVPDLKLQAQPVYDKYGKFDSYRLVGTDGKTKGIYKPYDSRHNSNIAWQHEGSNMSIQEKQLVLDWLFGHRIKYNNASPEQQKELIQNIKYWFDQIDTLRNPIDIGIIKEIPAGSPPFTNNTIFEAYTRIFSIDLIEGDKNRGDPVTQSVKLALINFDRSKKPEFQSANQFVWTSKEAVMNYEASVLYPKGNFNKYAIEDYSTSFAALLFDWFVKNRPGIVPSYYVTFQVDRVNAGSYPF